MATNNENKTLTEYEQFLAEHPDLLNQEELALGTAEVIFQQLEQQGMTIEQLALAVRSTPTTLKHAMRLGMTNELKGRIAAALRCNWKIELVPRP
ncbi:MAG: hypothetical protein HY092_02660 [Candidatus Kerfeldbacteria bacterium]|nr:hypothetical protein [Candidatus Kerfeldbacteria bacterium]